MTITTIKDIENLSGVKIQYVAEVPLKWDESRKTNVDQWCVVVESSAGSHYFDYFTGLGLRTPIPAQYLEHNPPSKGTLAYEALEREHRKPKAPKIADVLHSLILDASAADDNFNDWCDNFGYSTDSIKAFITYRECLDTAAALRKHFPRETLDRLRELVQDY